jgi:glycosyltransferase involved in cell wall biosynthesis
MTRTVLFCTQTATVIGGVATWLAELCEHLSGTNWRPVVALAHGRYHDAYRYAAAYPSLDTVVLDGSSGSRAARVTAIRRAAQEQRADVIVPLSIADAYEAAARMKLSGAPVRLLVAAHGPSSRMLADVVDHRAFCDVAVAVSKLTAHLLEHGVAIDPTRIRHIANGIGAPIVARIAKRPDDPWRIGYVGRLDEDKRARDLIGFCDELDRRDLRYRLRIAGSGVHEHEIRSALAPHVVDGRVVFHGALRRDEILASIYPQLDCIVSFSASEGFPLVPIEAMSFGVVPVLSRYRGCIAEGMTRSGETALLFDVGNVGDAADEVVTLARDAVLAGRLSAAGQREARGRTIETMALRWREALDAAVTLPPMCGVTLPWPLVNSGRLDRWLSPSMGDRVRGALGRRFVHRGTDEWPFAGPENASAIRRLDQLAESFESGDVPCAG